jgi:putative ABC transport system substrate-binding protein
MFDVRRRDFITLLGGAAAAWPLAARAQQTGGMRRIGVLMGYAETDAQAQVASLRQELQKLGWEEGRNIRIDVRFPAADAGRVRAILMELMSLRPEVLVSNSNLVTAVVSGRTINCFYLSAIRSVPVLSVTRRVNGNPQGYEVGDIHDRKWPEQPRKSRPGSNASAHGASRDGRQRGFFKLLKAGPALGSS